MDIGVKLLGPTVYSAVRRKTSGSSFLYHAGKNFI